MSTGNRKTSPLENAAGLFFESFWDSHSNARLAVRSAEVVFDLGAHLVVRIDRPLPGGFGTLEFCDRGQFLTLNFPAMRQSTMPAPGATNAAAGSCLAAATGRAAA